MSASERNNAADARGMEAKLTHGLNASEVEQRRIDNYFSQNQKNLKDAINQSITDPNNQMDANGQTHCNNVPPQVLNKLGMNPSSILNKDSKGNPIATKATDQLTNLSKSSDWHTVDGKQAQSLANQGVPIIAGATGHVGVVFPGTYSNNNGPQIGQAGTSNGVYSATGSGFVTAPTYYAPVKW